MDICLQCGQTAPWVDVVGTPLCDEHLADWLDYMAHMYEVEDYLQRQMAAIERTLATATFIGASS